MAALLRHCYLEANQVISDPMATRITSLPLEAEHRNRVNLANLTEIEVVWSPLSRHQNLRCHPISSWAVL